jgi:hypothetical protein
MQVCAELLIPLAASLSDDLRKICQRGGSAGPPSSASSASSSSSASASSNSSSGASRNPTVAAKQLKEALPTLTLMFHFVSSPLQLRELIVTPKLIVHLAGLSSRNMCSRFHHS